MQVPCPVPLSGPWSPMGYQVVELLDPTTPEKPPMALLVGEKPESHPASPTGYRVVMVSEERVPATARPEQEPQPEFPSFRRLRRETPRTLSGPAVVGIIFACTSAATLGFFVFSQVFVHRNRGPVVAVQNKENFVAPVRQVKVVLPPGLEIDPRKVDQPMPGMNVPAFAVPVEAPVVAKVAPAPEREGAVALDELPVFANHRTAVGFVRNVHEANLLATKTRKLVMVLHVSGNFEDPEFT